MGIPLLLFDTTEPLQTCERTWKKDESFNVTWGFWEAIFRIQTGIFSTNNLQNRPIFETGVENTDIGVGILRGGNKSSVGDRSECRWFIPSYERYDRAGGFLHTVKACPSNSKSKLKADKRRRLEVCRTVQTFAVLVQF